ncbi:MAG: hypothetical protein CM1200mP9_08540 [Gammaproteobacteria bacterium]|nr:MAG: hypothetical protein CM1200mP9_08540 [Gammaproteobacteria bacterium]
MVGEGMARVSGEVADVIMPQVESCPIDTCGKFCCPTFEPDCSGGSQLVGFEISEKGYLVIGDDDSEIEQKLLGMRRALSFYGSTRTYHEVLRTHGLEELGQKFMHYRYRVSGKKCGIQSLSMI